MFCVIAMKVCLRIDSDTSVEDVKNRVFVIDHKFILSDLKKLAHYFGMRWNFCTSRSDRTIKCNRATLHGSRVDQGLRNITSATCACDWSIRFRGMCRSNNKILDPVVITSVNSLHSNTRDPSYVGQFFCHEHDMAITSVVVVKS